MKRSLRSWLWQVPVDQEVDEELAFHVEMRTRELVERGMDAEAARELAVRRLGDVGQLKRTCLDPGRKRDREMRLTVWLQEFRDDVTFAVRQLRGAPAFTIVAALTLALGISASQWLRAEASIRARHPRECSRLHRERGFRSTLLAGAVASRPAGVVAADRFAPIVSGNTRDRRRRPSGERPA